ncbi:MAG: tetratricopeptide repeat-containing sensor histidine kinase [Thermoflexibacter sp.]|nr:tetratricopeptide repeat-containing sensor histidine kinase [Thermoflexibacter sp.]
MTYKIFIALFIYCIYLTPFAFSQTPQKIDSLKKVLSSSKEDSNKVITLAALARFYRFSQTDTAEILATQGLRLAEKIRFLRGQGSCLNHLGVCAYARSNYQKALDYHLKGLAIRQKINDKDGMAGSMNNIGNVYKEMGDLTKALEYYQKTLKIDRENANRDNVPHDLINISTVCSEQGNYSIALESLLESKTLFTQNNDTEGLGLAHNNMGIIYQRLGDEPNALKNYEEALKNFEKVGYERGQSEALINIGTIYQDQKNYTQSLSYYQKALSHAQMANSKYTIALIKGNISSVFSLLGRYQEAEQHIKEAIILSKEIGSLQLEANNYFILAELFEKQGDYEQALTYAKRSETINQNAEKRENTPKILYLIAKIYAQKKDFSKAYSYFELAKAREDSILSLEKQKMIANVESKYQIAQRQTKIELLEKEQLIQKQELENSVWQNSFYITISVFLTFSLIALFFYLRKKEKTNRLLQRQNEAIQKRNEEINAQREAISIQKDELHQQAEMLTDLNRAKEKLFSIIAHDLRAPLNSLKGMMEIFLLDAAETNMGNKVILEKLKRDLESNHLLLNNLLNWSYNQSNGIQTKKTKFPIAKIVEEKVALFKDIYQSKDVTLHSTIPADMVVFADENQVKIVIHNLLSNAVKFTTKGGTVIINTVNQGEYTKISIQDTGIGMSKEEVSKLFDNRIIFSKRGTQNEKGTGLGLLLCKDFIDNQGGKIWVESEEGKGSTFFFTLEK